MHLTALLRSWGGIERLIAGFPEGERARLVLKLAESERELRQRAREAERREREAVKDASKDPGCVAVAAEILRKAGWTVKPPE